MRSRLDRVVPKGTNAVILRPGGNDTRKGVTADRARNIAAIQNRLNARGIKRSCWNTACCMDFRISSMASTSRRRVSHARRICRLASGHCARSITSGD
jgi:hypothetical protein